MLLQIMLLPILILNAVNRSPKFWGKEIQLTNSSCNVVVSESETWRQVMSCSLLDIYTGSFKLFPMGNASLISNTLGFCLSW